MLVHLPVLLTTTAPLFQEERWTTLWGEIPQSLVNTLWDYYERISMWRYLLTSRWTRWTRLSWRWTNPVNLSIFLVHLISILFSVLCKREYREFHTNFHLKFTNTLLEFHTKISHQYLLKIGPFFPPYNLNMGASKWREPRPKSCSEHAQYLPQSIWFLLILWGKMGVRLQSDFFS